jgi:hypothetical protein
VPAELPDMEPEPARSEKVFVEQQPERREAPPGTFMPVSTEVASLYSCWFRNPYSYMFHGGTDALEVNGGYYGMFMAGVHGILYYGNLNNCAGELIGQPPGWYSDIAPIEAFAGVPASLPSTTYSFATVNPEFIAYARRQLLPPPDQAIDGIPVQLAYDRVFRRFFRLMTVSLMTVLETTDIARETDDYLAATSAGQDGITWLEGRYNGRIAGFPEGWDGTTLTAPMAAGFWLRRHADKSFAASWHGLREVLDRYDPAWLAEQKAQYPKAAAALEQLPDPMVTQP